MKKSRTGRDLKLKTPTPGGGFYYFFAFLAPFFLAAFLGAAFFLAAFLGAAFFAAFFAMVFVF
jgi:hypothetical protein